MRILVALGSQPKNQPISQALISRLSAREREIAALICDGLSNKEIARHLQITEGTVKIHLHNIYGKLELRNRTALAAVVQAWKIGSDEFDFATTPVVLSKTHELSGGLAVAAR
jgi:DNA-binding NarL/FixJ family response regulator